MKGWAIKTLFAGIAATAAGAVAIPTFNGLTQESDVPVFRVERSSFARTVVADGVLEAEKTTPLTAPNEVRQQLTVAWLAPDGTRVEADEIVVRFDPTEMQQSLLDGQSQKDTALNRMGKKETESEAVFENLERDEQMAGRELDYARDFQSKDPDIFSRSEIIESEIDQDLATRRRDHAQETRRLQEDLSAVELELIELEKRKADLKIDQAEAGLRSLEIRSPHAGIFVLKRDWRGVTQVGQSVWPGQPLAELPRLDVMQAKVFVLEADAGGLEEGVTAEVVLEAHPLKRFQGLVKNVAALAQRRNRRSPVQYFEVILELEVTDPDMMKPGQRVRADLFLEDLDDVVSIPRQAVIEEEDGDKLVYRRSGGGFDAVKVELGAAALGRVVVESGLEEGDVIALSDPTRRSDRPDSPAAGSKAPGGPGDGT
jgi:multidrug efflux pump subunit AcrA (membrane-fusion protein)